jgi:hypothetical protein
MAERARLGSSAPDLDISGFTPKPKQPERPVEEIREASEKAGLVSREPPKKPLKKADRRYRTGRNIPLTTKISPRANELLNGIYEQHKDETGYPTLKVGQILEYGLELYRKELDSRNGQE